MVAVGSNGSDKSSDGGSSWEPMGKENLNAVAAGKDKMVWAVGPAGLVVRQYFGKIVLDG